MMLLAPNRSVAPPTVYSTVLPSLRPLRDCDPQKRRFLSAPTYSNLTGLSMDRYEVWGVLILQCHALRSAPELITQHSA